MFHALCDISTFLAFHPHIGQRKSYDFMGQPLPSGCLNIRQIERCSLKRLDDMLCNSLNGEFLDQDPFVGISFLVLIQQNHGVGIRI